MKGTFGPSPAVAGYTSIAEGLADFGFEELLVMADLAVLRSLFGLECAFLRFFRITLTRFCGNESGMANGRNARYAVFERDISRCSPISLPSKTISPDCSKVT